MKTLIFVFSLFMATSLFSQNQNLSQEFVFEGEPYLSINPENSDHLVVAWLGWVNLQQLFKIHIITSFDGGTTWSEAYEVDHTVDGYSSPDPCIQFNHLGEVFVSFIDFTGTEPPVTGGVYLVKSKDGGLTWGDPLEVITTDFDGEKWPIDRPWMEIDRSDSPTQGNIYVTTFNLNRLNPPFNPYLSVSTDNGESFTSKIIDAEGWLAGSINPLPLCFPAISSDGVFYGSYPSLVFGQNLFVQSFLAVSDDAGESIEYKNIITFNPPSNLGDFPLAKKASILLCNPADANHIAHIYLSAVTGDLDVYLIESFDAGDSWTEPLRVNDDPIENDVLQDLIWGDFDSDGDLVISWRDRRNGTAGTFESATEIWASFRENGSNSFESNFQISSETVAYDEILENAGNDFMCVKLQEDIIHTTWGDTRDGALNIWYQKLTTDGTIVSTHQISSKALPKIDIYPNPVASECLIKSDGIKRIELHDQSGKLIMVKKYDSHSNEVKIDLASLPSGTYFIHVETIFANFIEKINK